MNIYAIKDELRKKFLQPFFSDPITVKRSIITMRENDQTELHRFPEQFTLYYLGEVDEETGVIKASRMPIDTVSDINFETLEEGDDYAISNDE